jgi:ABC-type amino acid transport substrate-binding protein
MKRTVYFLMFIFFILSSCKTQKIITSEEDLNGIFDIKWGDSVSTAAEILNNKKNISIEYISDEVIHVNGNIMGYNGNIDLYFFDDIFLTAQISYFLSKNEYYKFIKSIINKYGEPETTAKDSKYYIWTFKNNCTLTLNLHQANHNIVLLYFNRMLYFETLGKMNGEILWK